MHGKTTPVEAPVFTGRVTAVRRVSAVDSEVDPAVAAQAASRILHATCYHVTTTDHEAGPRDRFILAEKEDHATSKNI